MDKPKKIKDNPSISKISNQIESFDAITKLSPIIQKIFPKTEPLFKQFNEIKKQAEIFDMPDKFNERFADLGWVAYESMNIDIMEKAIKIFDLDGKHTAEQFLTEYFNAETIEWGIKRFNGHPEFERRIRLAELAKEDYLSERYHACIPLLLSLLDGIVNDVSKHVGFFAESIDLTVWDSIAAHDSGLQTIAKLFTKSRTKTNIEPLSIPYRHGILHGRELAFDNKLVAAKTWAALFAARDWANAVTNSTSKSTSKTKAENWTSILSNLAKTQRQKILIENWRPRTSKETNYLPYSGKAKDLPLNTPERIVAEFIENWIAKRYGLLADRLYCITDKSKGKRAGKAKSDFGKNIPQSFKIISIKDTAAARTLVRVELNFEVEGQNIFKLIDVITIYQDFKSKPLVRDEKNGQWVILQMSFSDILYSPLIP